MKHILDTDNIPKILFKMSLPAMVGMIFMAMYNIVDTIFIGKGVGALGIAGVAIVFPIQMIIMSIGQMVGIGGASLISRSLGKKDFEKANMVLTSIISIIFFLSVPIIILSSMYIEELLYKFGATKNILPYAKSYMEVIILAAFFVGISMSLNNIVRADGRAKAAMFTMMMGGLVNVILDAIFIFYFKMGIAGAAWATFIAHTTTATFLMFYIFTGKTSLKFELKYMIPKLKIVYEVFGIGIGVFIRQASGSILVAIMNNTIAVYGGDIAIAAFGILFRLTMLSMTPMIGIAQGIQPIAGFNYGAKRYKRVKESIKISVLGAFFVGVGGFVFLTIFARELMSVFTNDAGVVDIGVNALKIIIMAMPLVGFQIIGSSVFQALGKIFPSFILAISRQLLFLIPLVLILPKFLKLNGVWLSIPIADTLAAFLTLIMIVPLWKKLKK